MFCQKCGAEVKDGSSFCPNCGAKLEVAIAVHKNSVKKDEKNNGLSIDDLSNLNESLNAQNYTPTDSDIQRNSLNQARQASFSVEEREKNAVLFDIFRKLIKPVQAVERLQADIENKLLIINSPAELLEHPFGKGLNIFLCIAICIFNLIFETHAFDEAMELFFWYIPRIDDISKFSNGIIIFIVFILPVFIYPVAIVIILNLLTHIILSQINKSRQRKKDEISKILSEQVAEERQAQKDIIHPIIPYICYIPPDYRSSECITIMVQNYDNCAVDNLKEAVNKCQEVQFRHEVIGYLRNIDNTLRKISGQIDQVIANENIMIANQVATNAMIAYGLAR